METAWLRCKLTLLFTESATVTTVKNEQEVRLASQLTSEKVTFVWLPGTSVLTSYPTISVPNNENSVQTVEPLFSGTRSRSRAWLV